MSRPSFRAWMGVDDTTTPTELYALVNAFRKRHGLRSAYAALDDMLRLTSTMDRTPLAATDGGRMYKQILEDSGDKSAWVEQEFWRG